MATFSVTVTYGTAEDNAASTTAFPDLQQAMANAMRAACDYETLAPLYSILIRPGDHAARIRNGQWVDAPATGWES